MATLGVLARIDVQCRPETVAVLEELDGVSTFGVQEEERVGLLIEGDSLDLVHHVLVDQVQGVPGVLGTWPIYASIE